MTGICTSSYKLFNTIDWPCSGTLIKALDRINSDFGSGTLRYAAEGLRPRRRMKQAHKSQRFTTCWSELAQVHAR